jgi:glutathione peroxidase
MGFFDFIKRKGTLPEGVPVSFYDLSALTIEGETYNFSLLRGKKVLIVNVASKCGYTPQYEELEKLYKEFGGDRFEIIGFPSNDFLNQESGTDEQIKAFCSLTYGVSFPLMSKVKVKGKDKHPVYTWLTAKMLNGYQDSRVKWNFQKYMIGPDGKLERIAYPADKPYSQEILSFIKT